MRGFVMLAVLWVGSWPPALFAQAPERNQLEERVRRAFVQRVQRQLQLDDAEVGELREVLAWSEGQRRALSTENQDLERRSQAVRFEGSDDEARAILDGRLRIQERQLELYREEQQRLLEVLSPARVVRFYRLRAELNRRILQLRGQRGGNP